MRAWQSCLFVVALLPLLVSGWGDTGHTIVAEVARRTLDPSVVESVNKLTKSYWEYFPEPVSVMPYAATFMDYIKRDTK